MLIDYDDMKIIDLLLIKIVFEWCLYFWSKKKVVFKIIMN